MFRSIVIAATAASFAVVAVPVPASAQSVLGSACNPATGLGPNGRPCKGLVRLSNDRINAGDRIENVPTLNRSELAEVFDCRDLDSLGGVGVGGVEALVEDCGTAAPPATLTNFQPYAGEALAAAPPPPPPAALPPAPLPPAALPPAPPVFAPVQAAGLGGSIVPLALGAAGLAAVVGIAIAIGDDDDDSSNSTVSTPGT